MSDGNEEASSLSIALAATRDALPIAGRVSNWIFDKSSSASELGFQVGDTVAGAWQKSAVAGAVGTVALGALGVVGTPLALGVGAVTVTGALAATATRAGLSAARRATQAGLSAGKATTEAVLAEGESHLESTYGLEKGATLRLALGRDTASALTFVRSLLLDFGLSPPPGMNWSETADAARTLAWLQHAAGVIDTPQQRSSLPLPNAVEWATIQRQMRFSLACYGHLALRVLRILPVVADEPLSDLKALTFLTGDVTEADVLVAEWESSTFAPGFLVVLDHRSAAIVVAIRGSHRVQDALTDLVCEHASFESPLGKGEAHAGMLKAATRLLARIRPSIDDALRAHQRYGLVFTGHSLGGGMAALLALLVGPHYRVGSALDEEGGGGPGGSTPGITSAPVRAFTFGSAAVVSLDLARAASSLVTAVVAGSDMVPRLGLASTHDLRDVLGALHHEAGLIARVAVRRSHTAPEGGLSPVAAAPPDDENAAWARSILSWLHHAVYAQRTKLYPPGLVLWRPSGAAEAMEAGEAGGWAAVDPAEFGYLLLSGSQMLTTHVPNAYARVLLGESGLPLAPLAPLLAPVDIM